MRLRRAALLCLTPVKLILGYDDLAIAQSNLYHPPPADLEQMTVTSTFQHNEQLTADTNPKDVGFLLATTVAEEDAVVFTKTSLVQFLKLHGIQVDTNYTELKRLPKYATFGKLSKSTTAGTSDHAAAASQSSPAARGAEAFARNDAVRDAEGREFKPTRRVREEIGGGSAQIAALFGSDDDASAVPNAGRRQVQTLQSSLESQPIQPKPRGFQDLQPRPNSNAPPSKGDPTHPKPNPADPRSAEQPIQPKPREFQDLQPRPNSGSPPSNGSPGHPTPNPGHPRSAERPLQPTTHQSGDQVVEPRSAPAPPSAPSPLTSQPQQHQRHTSEQQQQQEERKSGFVPSKGVRDSEGREFRPTRRVREAIGGGSEQIASLFGGDEENEAPRRR